MSTETKEKDKEEKVDPYANLRGKSDDDIKEMINTNDPEIMGIIANPEERAKLTAGELTAPLKEEEEKPAPADKEPEDSGTDPDKDPPADKEKVEKGTGDFDGYESLEELKEANKSLRDLLKKKQKNIDENNAKAGQRGAELKRLQEEAAELKRKNEEAQRELEKRSLTATTKEEIEIPDLPTVPVPVDGDYLDDDYKRSVKDYETKMKAYDTAVKKSLKSRTPAESPETENIKKELAETKKLLAEIKANQDKGTEEKAQYTRMSAVEKVFSEVDKLQEDNPELKTTHSFKEIDDFVAQTGLDLASALEEAKSVYPVADLKKYINIHGLVVAQRGVDANGTIDIYNDPRDALQDRYDLYKIKNKVVVDKPKKEETDDNSAVELAKRNAEKLALERTKNLTPGLDVTDMGGEVDKVGYAAAVKEFEEFTDRLNANPRLRDEPDVLKRWKELGLKIGFKVPEITIHP